MGTAQDSSSTSNPMARVGQMQELRNLATFLMADGCDYLTGETIAIDGRRLPRRRRQLQPARQTQRQRLGRHPPNDQRRQRRRQSQTDGV